MRKLGITTSYLLPVTTCMFVSLGFVRLFISSSLNQSLPRIIPGGVLEQLVWTLFLTIVGLMGVTFIYWLIRRQRNFELRVLFAIIFAPTSAILLIVFSQTLLMVFAKTISSLMISIIILASLYLAIFSIIFIISDALSTRVRNFIFTLYGALLGSFVSLLIPTISLIIMLLSVALYDLVILNMKWMAPIINEIGQSRSAASRFSYVGENIEVGIGELIFYSFIPAHVEAYYSPQLLVITLVMTLSGILFNQIMLKTRDFLPGLPVPIFLGLIPLVLSFIL